MVAPEWRINWTRILKMRWELGFWIVLVLDLMVRTSDCVQGLGLRAWISERGRRSSRNVEGRGGCWQAE